MDKVYKSITKDNIDIVKNERSIQIILGPGPDTSVIIKAAETLHQSTSINMIKADFCTPGHSGHLPQ